MASLEIRDMHKSYGKKIALKGIDLTVADGEFFVILGPSGAGKTTTLKSIAGLQEIDSGTVRIGDVDMAGVEPYRRNVAMAFESYALYPQDTVFENLASPLRSGRLGKVSAEEQKQRIEMVTTTLGINQLLQRFPRELSNGQRQRVALGRVLVRPAGIYLLDEPLSHLDAKLRASMRAELKHLGAMSKTTSVYVTHDYQEALALGDKIAVLHTGRVVQVGSPLDLWRAPANTFVARSLGQPEMNLLPAVVDGGSLIAAGGEIKIPVPDQLGLARGTPVVLGVRPREIEVGSRAPEEFGWATVSGTVRLAEVLGRLVELSVMVGDIELIVVVDTARAPDEGEQISFHLPLSQTLVFDAAADDFAAHSAEPDDDVGREAEEADSSDRAAPLIGTVLATGEHHRGPGAPPSDSPARAHSSAD